MLLFDDGLVSDSGRLLLYEPDEIGSIPPEALAERYGKNATQSLGRVYNGLGQFIGACVSKSQRGREVFDPARSYLLRRDPSLSGPFGDLWLMPRNIFRVSQGRGVTPTASSLASIIDLQDYIGFELASAKKNAQTLAVVNQTSPDVADIPDAFDAGAIDVDSMTDEQIKELVKAQEAQTPTMTLDKISAAGAIYQVMPENYRLELLDTKHPNVNSIEFVRWLAQASAAPFGLTNCYATLKVDSSYSGYRGEQLMAQPAFEEAQHFLEQICDWTFYRWAKWAAKKGVIRDTFDETEMRNVSWCWPKMKDVDAVKEQNAIALKIKNNTCSLREILGPDWREKLLDISEEIEFCKQNGIPHPALQTVSGQVIDFVKDEGEKPDAPAA